MPVQARAAATDQGKASISLGDSAAVGTTKLAPGDYDIKADASNVTFTTNGRVVVQAHIEWKDESSKAAATTVDYDGGKVAAIHFKGKSRFAVISE